MTQVKYNSFVLDLECISQPNPTGAITELSIAFYNGDTVKYKQWFIDWERSISEGYTYDKDTHIWLKRTPNKAKLGSVFIYEAIQELLDFINDNCPVHTPVIYCNTSFDVPRLEYAWNKEDAFHQLNLGRFPFIYFRDINTLLAHLGLRTKYMSITSKNPRKHDSLEDALYELKALQYCGIIPQ